MVYIILLFLMTLLPSFSWCPFDPSLLEPVQNALSGTTPPTLIPQCAGLTFIGCAALYSWYSCNEKAIRLTTLCGALASSYILYKYVNGQEEIKELVTNATNHIIQTNIASETRISNNLQRTSDHTQKQISSIHHSLQNDLINLQQEVGERMDASIAEIRGQFCNIQEQNDRNHLELEHTIQTSSAHLEHISTQRYLELNHTIDQKKEELDKLMQESTNYTIAQMHSMFQDLARAQSINLQTPKHRFIPQKLTHNTSPTQAMRRSISQPEITYEPMQPSLIMYQQNINQEFEQTKETLQQKYTQKQALITTRYASQHTTLQQAPLSGSQATYQHGALTKPETVEPVIFDAPEATPFAPKSTIAAAGQSGLLRWVNIFSLFNMFTR